MSKGSEALSMVMCSMAVEMIEKDPELIERLRKHCVERGAPFDGNDITATMLTMASMDALEIGQRAVHAHDKPTGRGMMAGAVIPIPRMEGAARESADALGVASFTTEFVHAAEGEFERFCAWMRETHPSATDPDQEVRLEQVKAADEMLTTMAHVADHIADREAGPSVGHDEKGRAPEEPTEIRYDDGTRHI